jgi:GTPase SAR1 family protein
LHNDFFFVQGSNAIVVTFDMTDKETLYHAEHWLYDALGVTNNKNNPLVFLVGTKYDLLVGFLGIFWKYLCIFVSFF